MNTNKHHPPNVNFWVTKSKLLTCRLVITHTYIFQLNSVVKDELSTSLKNNFREDKLNGSNQLSNGWNYIFLTVRLGFRVSLTCIQQIQKDNYIFISSINHQFIHIYKPFSWYNFYDYIYMYLKKLCFFPHKNNMCVFVKT